MKRFPSSLACVIAAVLMAATTPAFGVNGSCGFNAGGTVGLAFGSMNPSVGGPRTATGQVEVGSCKDVVMSVTIDQGQRGNRTMKRVSGTETIAYSIGPVTIAGGSAAPGNGNHYKVASFTGTVQANAYLGAVAGAYQDILIVTVTP